MGIKNLFGLGAEKIISASDKLIDNVSTTDQEKLSLKNQLSKIVMDTMISISQDNLTSRNAEIKSDSWLASNWRPIVMLGLFFILVHAHFTGTLEAMPPDFLKLIKIGLGGYGVTRSVEKIADKVTKNIDLSFLKKKYRKQNEL